MIASPPHSMTQTHPATVGGRLLSSVRRYTRFVLLSKLLLWAAALALLVALIVTGWVNSGEGGPRIVFNSIQKSEGGDAVMTLPRFQGVDAKNQPFTVTADSATQKDEDTVVLKNMNADMTFENTKWAALTATSGVLQPKAKKLDLAGSVEMFYDGGYAARTSRALVDMDAGEVEGPEPVEAQGPSGTIKSKRFKILERGRVLRFEKDVNVVLYMGQK